MFNRYYKIIKWYLLNILFIVGLLIGLGSQQLPFSSKLFYSVAIAQEISLDQLMQRGADLYQVGKFTEAIEDWQAALARYQKGNNLESKALVLENLARAYQSLGQTSEEIRYWEQASLVYRQLKNMLRLERALTEQAQAYSRLGQYRNAIFLLCGDPADQVCSENSAVAVVRSLTNRDRIGEVAALGSLGDAYRLRGAADRAITYLQQGLAIAREIQDSIYLTSILSSLGNTEISLAQLNYRRAVSARQIGELLEAETFESKARTHNTEALNYLKESFALAEANHDRSGQVRALISTISVYYRLGNQLDQKSSLQQSVSLVRTLSNSREKVFASIDLARFMQIADTALEVSVGEQCASRQIDAQAESLLKQAISVSQEISDRRAESFALGELGHFYECQLDYEQALKLTQQAQLAADQDLQARDSLYLWQWQAGRIFRAQGKAEESIRAYEESLATLNSLRKDILTASRDVQFDFRETVEPIYRELVELRLLQEEPSIIIHASSETKGKSNISLALNTLDNLKLAELQNYFGNDCVLTALSEVNINFDSSAPKTAIFSTVLLGDRVAAILSIPTQQSSNQQQSLQQLEWIKDDNKNYIDQTTLISVINDYRKGLEKVRDAVPSAPLGGYNPEQAKKIYDWVIRPFESLLQENKIQTLVFVQDGIFRSVPMAALYDGKAFLIDRYAIAVTPGLNLTNLEKANRQQLRALAVGLTQSATVDGRPFAALNYVETELQAVKEILPRSLELQDQSFTRDRFQQELEKSAYPIIHIATHGNFSAEAEDAFLVTGYNPDQPNQKLTLTDLDNIIRQASTRSPLELLVLSACQTAAGDDRAALGLAGVAAQAGAKRVLASLWSINDQATTQLVTKFYQGLFSTDLTQAQALQAAQKALIASEERVAHPAFWSAFILIGNWL